jgi:hypothetical protein
MDATLTAAAIRRQGKVASMFSVMTWNLENFERPAANAEQAVKDRYARKLQQISELVTSAGPVSGTR